jgi:hypothetical protein
LKKFAEEVKIQLNYKPIVKKTIKYFYYKWIRKCE